MNSERKILGILSIVLASLALLGSYLPFINNASFIVAGISLILGLVALLVNRKRKKTLAWVGVGMSILAMVIVLVTQAFYGKVMDDAGKEFEKNMNASQQQVQNSIAQSQADAEAKFKWTKEDFEKLVVGDALTGVGGTNYNEVISRFGEPQIKSESVSGEYTQMYISYNNMGSANYKDVSLTFSKQKDGTWSLSYKSYHGF